MPFIPKHTSNSKSDNPNPFRTDKADLLWEKLDNEGIPISKKELLQRAKALKAKSGPTHGRKK